MASTRPQRGCQRRTERRAARCSLKETAGLGRTVDPYPYYFPSTGGPLVGWFLGRKKFLTVAHSVEDGRSRPQCGLKEAATAALHAAHWDLLEILVWKFKRGNQLVL